MKKDVGVKRVVAVFSGLVQGVGFRFTTISIAGDFKVTGYVKNLDNGDVEVVAEGAEETLEKFISAIQSSFLARYIRSTKINYENATGKFKGFDVEC